MGLYKVMLVDDEEEVRFAIEKRLNWEEFGFEVVATAENGRDALEIVLDVKPDVVMTDIHMPFMTGLEFAHKMKELLPATKIIIFSGYDDFEYAKEAISLEAEEYILKPIDSDELKRVFERIKSRLDEEFDKRRNLERLESYYQKSVPFLREQFLVSLFEGRTAYEYFQLNMQSVGISLESKYYVVGILKLSFDKSEDAKNISSQHLLSMSLNQLVNDRLKDECNIYTSYYLGRTVVLGLLDEKADQAKFLSVMDTLCKLSGQILEQKTYAGVGNTVEDIEDIVISYKQADESLNYSNFYDENQAFCINDVEPEWLSIDVFDDRITKEIIKQIKLGTKEELTAAVKTFMDKISNTKIAAYQLDLSFVEIYFEIMRLIKGYELEPEQITELEFDVYSKIKELTTIDARGQWLNAYCLQVRSIIRQERKDSTKQLMDNAIDYISTNYNKSDLSVDDLCNHLGVSPTYFSSLFKKHTGVSFVTYLTNVRMEKAMELLNNTDEKSYVIAGMIGYDEPNYFSYVFKKAYGISPSKYRQKRDAE